MSGAVSAARAKAARRPARAARAPPAATTEERRLPEAPAEKRPPPPFLLDFYPLETENFTRLHSFFDALKAGRFTTTRCRRDGALLWPPRIVCPRCHTEELDWVDLPRRGTVYAFSAVLAGAPLGMEKDVPFVVALVDLEGVPLRIFGRLVGTAWNECRIGQRVEVEPYRVDDGRVFYRFRTEAPRDSAEEKSPGR